MTAVAAKASAKAASLAGAAMPPEALALRLVEDVRVARERLRVADAIGPSRSEAIACAGRPIGSVLSALAVIAVTMAVVAVRVLEGLAAMRTRARVARPVGMRAARAVTGGPGTDRQGVAEPGRRGDGIQGARAGRGAVGIAAGRADALGPRTVSPVPVAATLAPAAAARALRAVPLGPAPGTVSVARAVVAEPVAVVHSTVTDLARLRGWSTSHPRLTAM